MNDPWLPAEHGTDQHGLRQRAARGLTWTMVEGWGRQAFNLAIFVILARLLTPVDFGLVALAAVFVALAHVVVDQGLGDVLIQRREVTRSHIDTAFWVAVATGVLLTLAGLVLADPISALLREPHLKPILQVLSLTFALAALSSIQIALLRRELAFRSLAMRALLATFSGGVIGITIAYLGYGAWALVAQQLAHAAVSVIVLWSLSPWRPRFHMSLGLLRQLLPFGLNVVGSDILTFLSRNGDKFLIGAALGTTPLGFYAVGYRILDVTQVLLINVARKITFPVFSRLQHDRERMRRAYFRVTRAGGLVILPGYVGLALVAPEMTVLVFGQRWSESGAVAAVLFLIGPALSITAFSGSLLTAVGHPGVVLKFRLITTVTNIVGFAIAVPFGILAVAGAFVARSYLLLPLNLYWMRVYAGIPAREYLGQLRGVAFATAFMAAAVLAIKYLIGPGVSLGILLATEVALGAMVFFACIWVFERRLIHEVIELVQDAIPTRARDRRPRQSLPAGEIGVAGELADLEDS